MLLISHEVRLRQPRAKVRIDVGQLREPEDMEVVSRRKRFDLSKARMLEPPGQHEVSVQPSLARGDLRERHAHLERDPRFLGKNAHRTDGTNRGGHFLEERTNRRRLAVKVMTEREPPAGV